MSSELYGVLFNAASRRIAIALLALASAKWNREIIKNTTEISGYF